MHASRTYSATKNSLGFVLIIPLNFFDLLSGKYFFIIFFSLVIFSDFFELIGIISSYIPTISFGILKELLRVYFYFYLNQSYLIQGFLKN